MDPRPVLVNILAAAALAAGALACSEDESSPLGPSGPDTGAAAAADAGVSDAGEATPDGGGADAASSEDAGTVPRTVTLGGDRPAPMWVPRDYDGAPHPLVVLLHGYSSSGADQNRYFQLSERVDDRSFFLVLPDGTEENSPLRNRFWNATGACCDFTQTGVDDVAYLSGLVDEAATDYNIDPKRVFLVGHSNGGFMAYRMACDVAPRIAAIASLAGATFLDEDDCGASEPVSVLQIHGTNDATIRYGGGRIGLVSYPGAPETVGRWAERAGCDADLASTGRLDLERALPGEETDALAASGCDSGYGVQLWRVNQGGHVPALQLDFADRVLDFLFAHPKP